MDGNTDFDTTLKVLKIVGQPGPIHFETGVYFHSWDFDKKTNEDLIIVGTADTLITAEDIEALFATVTKRVNECHHNRTYWFEGLRLSTKDNVKICKFLWGS
jgi:hypothetical protein